MSSILINRAPIRNKPWGGGAQFVNAFYDNAKQNGFSVVNRLSDKPDYLFLFHPDPDELRIGIDEIYRHSKLHGTKVISRVNECDARKGTVGVDKLWLDIGSISNHSIFVSDWMRSYYEELDWNSKSSNVIWNGVSKERFVQLKKLSDENKKINIVCAHWSDNEKKGQKVYEFLDDFVSKNDDFTFTFIGRTKANLPNSSLVPPLSPEDLAVELTRYDICVNGTVADPGPNAVIESITAGLPTYVHSSGGGACEFAGADHLFTTSKELETLLLKRQFENNLTHFDEWDIVMQKVFATIKDSK